MTRQSFFVFLLIFLVGFLILPKNALADDFENIKLEEIGKYLELPKKDVNQLMDTLRQVFTTEGISVLSSGDVSDEKTAVVITLLKVAEMQALSHLLVDAPLEVLGGIIEEAKTISCIIYFNPECLLEKFEKLTVEKATEEGKRQLFQNEIKVTPGAIKFEYYSYKGGEKEIVLQYVMTYRPESKKRARVAIRFYMPNSIEAPAFEKYKGLASLYVPDLKKDLPPFIVEVSGRVEKDELLNNYWWINEKGGRVTEGPEPTLIHPAVKITFPPKVPDLGIRPLSFWERKVLKPIETTLKEVDIIITKVTGKSPHLVETWNKIKSFFSKIKEMAGLGGAQVSQLTEEGQSKGNETGGMGETRGTEKIGETDVVDIGSQQIPEPVKLTAEEMQGILDDIAEKIDIIAQQIAELAGETGETGKDSAEVSPSPDVVDDSRQQSQVVLDYNVSPPPPAPAPEPPYIQPQIFITEVQIETASSTDYDFIELYNPATSSVNLSGFQLKKRSSTGSESSVRLFPEGNVILAQGYFLWLNSDFASNSPEILANIISTQTLAKNNSIALFDKRDNLIDALAWGTSTNPFVEGFAFPQNPIENQSLGRRWSTTTQNYIDTDNNQNDFEIQPPTPGSQNQSPEPEPLPEPLPEPEPEVPSLAVVINEIAWAGTKFSSSDEWIELYNNTASPVDLTGWQLISSDGSPDITFSTSSILADSYYLLERTASNTTNVAEDQIYTGALNNAGEKLELRDASNNLIDSLDFSAGWPAGTSSPNYISMERVGIATSSWASNNLITRNGLDAAGNRINGTPRAKNSVSLSETTISGLAFDEFLEITLTYLGSPYIIQQSLIVPLGKTLKIQPGVTLKFEDSREIEIRGNLEAIGSEAEKIIFERNSTSIPGNDRYRLHFIESQNSIIDNASFIDGGRLTYVPLFVPWGYISGVIEAENTNISIKNSSITGAFPRGIISSGSTTIENIIIEGTGDSDWFFNTFALSIGGDDSFVASSTFRNNTIGLKITGGNPRIENNIFQENGTPILLEGGSSVIFSNNSAQNNSLNGIVVDGINISSDTVWQSNLPYISISKYNTIGAGATLTLKEGTVIKFIADSYLDISGRLITEGTLVNPVIFTSIYDDEYGGDTKNDGDNVLPQKGIWRMIRFNSQNATSTLDGTVIRYGGGGCSMGFCWGAINQVAGSPIEIKNSWIEKNIWGIFSDLRDCQSVFETLKLTNVAFSENDRDIALIYGDNCSP